MKSTSLLNTIGLRVWALFGIALLLTACSTTARDETANWSTERLYSEAKDEAGLGNWERAATLFERLEGRAVGTVMAQQAQLERAHVLYRSGDRAQALSVLERFMKLYPASVAMDYALYLQGIINFNDNLGVLGRFVRQDLSERDQQASRDAYQSFKQLVERYPQSRYASDAQLRMNYIVNSLAAYEIHVARYYLRRGAYLAAANRAQQAIQEFEQSPTTEEALFILAHSYDRMGLTQLRDDAQRVLQQNYPNSRLSVPGEAPNKTSAWWQLW